MELKDWLNSINFTKEDLSEEVKDYPPFIINRCLSGHIDCVLYANEMNMNHHLSKDMQYAFYLNALRKKKRFSPWMKKEKEKSLEIIKEYYGYSNDKASQALKIINKEQLEFIEKKLEKGGKK
jgi:hypothetical protein